MTCPGCDQPMERCGALASDVWHEWVRIGFVHTATKRPLCLRAEVSQDA